MDDARIELELTPNRGDCLSVEGIVREVAAALGRNPKIQSRTTKGPNDHALAVDIAET
ncbi:MAG: hypothetical protein R3A11_01025 [Bdellovibrionota bacterium]